MATRFPSTHSEDSDVLRYWCSVCKERSLEIEADFYCKKCRKFYCRTCSDHHSHGVWFNKKYLYGTNKINKWPVSKKMEDIILQCKIHEDEKLTAFCNEHHDLCCSICVVRFHRQCTTVTVKSKAVRIKSADLMELEIKLMKILTEMNQFQMHQENKMESLKVAYDELVRSMVEDMQLNIKSFLADCENGILNETLTKDQYTVHAIRQNISLILSDFEHGNVQEKKDEQRIQQASLMSMINICIRYQHDIHRLHVALRKKTTSPKISFIISHKCRENIQKYETFLKENFPNHELTVSSMTLNPLSIPKCYTDKRFKTAVCVIPDGHILVAERDNKTVTLLNTQYKPLSHCGLSTYPWDICQITPSEVAVTLDDGNKHMVQFITVDNKRLVRDRTLRLQHECKGIDYNQGALFVTSGTALYKYTLTGELVSKLYEDESVCCCAVCPTGDKLYITTWDQHKLLTLGRDGSVLACFTDPELEYPGGVNVTPAGQVLVCGWGSNNIIQVDSEGSRKLANLNKKFGWSVSNPWSVCYIGITSSIIVGQDEFNKLIYFELR